MSTTTPATAGETSPTGVVLPAGVTLGPFRETSQTGSTGSVVQGVLFPVTLPNGGTTSVFVPYSLLGNVPAVQQLFDDRINGLMQIGG